MALKNTLPLNPVVNILINLSTISAPRKAFNLACLMGNVPANVTSFANGARVVTYDSLNSMLEDGFTVNDRLYEAASLVFGQQKTPPNVAIGKIFSTSTTVDIAGENTYQITTNAAAGDTVTFGSLGGTTFTAGTGTGNYFAVGTDAAATASNLAGAMAANTAINALYNVTASGDTITVTEKTAGGGNTPPATMSYTGTIVIASGTPTTSTSTTTTTPETPLSTFTECRQADGEWYVGIYCDDITDAQILDVAQYVESCTPDSVFAFTTNESAVTDPQDGGIFSQLQALNYRRTIGQYSTDNPDAIAAIIGWAMGAMTGTINSAYTLAYKREVGVQAENYVQTFQTSKVQAIEKFKGNVYINRGTYYDIFELGTMFDGSYFDEIIYLDKFKNDMQLAIMDLLVANNKIAQTEDGMTRIKNAILTECEGIKKIGFIAGGVWKANDILDLKYGDTLPNGYLIQSEPIADQSQADRDARKAPPIYVALKLAGAIHHVTVQVDVNR